ncbi:MAG: hypothetical protein WCK58_05660 [Chloroflexota bacterium]
MREQLVAWAGDCRVEGDVELGEGRLSDRVNAAELLTFFNARLRALEDGREVTVDELEVERRELHVIEVQGRRGSPERRLRTVTDRVEVEVGPFVVTGSLHRGPSTQPLAPLAGWARFVPLTDAVIRVRGSVEAPDRQEVVLVNRERISRTERVGDIVVQATAPWTSLPGQVPDGG